MNLGFLNNGKWYQHESKCRLSMIIKTCWWFILLIINDHQCLSSMSINDHQWWSMIIKNINDHRDSTCHISAMVTDINVNPNAGCQWSSRLVVDSSCWSSMTIKGFCKWFIMFLPIPGSSFHQWLLQSKRLWNRPPPKSGSADPMNIFSDPYHCLSLLINDHQVILQVIHHVVIACDACHFSNRCSNQKSCEFWPPP